MGLLEGGEKQLLVARREARAWTLWLCCFLRCLNMAGKSRLLATRRKAGRPGSKNSWCFFAIVLGL